MTALLALGRHWRLALIAVLAGAAGLQSWRAERLDHKVRETVAALAQAQAAAAAARATVRDRDALIRQATEAGAREAEEIAAMMKGTCRAAFDAGHAARRCAPGEPGRVRDLRTLWAEGAFAGGPDPMPGQPDG